MHVGNDLWESCGGLDCSVLLKETSLYDVLLETTKRMSSNKLQPIYDALDSHNFNRAIKWCLALPPSFLIGQALLAHAYAKSSQRYKSMVTIQGILGKEGFPELQYEIKYALERRQEGDGTSGGSGTSSPQNNTSPAAQAQATSQARKGGKKGKKKPGPKPAPIPVVSPNPSQDTLDDVKDFDWIDQLDSPPVLPDNWEEALPSSTETLSDHTLLATLSMTLSSLRLQLTAYQMYTWSIATHSNDLELVRQTYLLGLSVLMAPQYQSITGRLLSQLQVTALQMARLQQEQLGASPATAWAAQTALWQIERAQSATTTTTTTTRAANLVDEKKTAMLPRLAESLALKSIDMVPADDHVLETEIFMLYMRTLDIQSKWEEKLAAVRKRLDDEKRKNPREDALRELKASCLVVLGRRDEARTELTHLLRRHPDNWDYWKLYLENNNNAGDEAMESSLALIEEVVEKNRDEIYPLRGPHLARIERELIRLQKGGDTDSKDLSTLVEEVIRYGNMFAQRASCALNDLSDYLQYLLKHGTVEDARSILDWVTNAFRAVPDSQDPSERRNQIRGYIFGVQVSYEILAYHSVLEKEWMPDWKEIVRVWKDFQAFEDPNQAQKENRAADDLILLAVQQIVRGENIPPRSFMLAAAILEAAIAYSPHNAYLKIEAMYMYSCLNAAKRSFELFRQIYVKHIQHESCAYVILPLLHAGGFYQEVILVCQDILRLQTSTIRDAAEFTGRAMECGTLDKASEFITFQTERMNKSMTTLEAKGLILDCAPMFQFEDGQPLGDVHGIVGGPEDHVRVCKMISEAHNPHAAFSLLRLRGSAHDNLEFFTENRDFDVLSYNVLAPRKVASREQILAESIRRRHHHSLLIRASLCLDATKGPKKGKVTKTSGDLSKRSSSLLACLHASEEYVKNGAHESELARTALVTMVVLCRAILAVSAGVVDGNDSELDSLELRDEAAARFFEKAVEAITQCNSAFTLQSQEVNPVPLVSRFVADCLVAVFALLQMCGSVLETYGWGKRKRGTRQSAGALGKFSYVLKAMIVEMRDSLDPLLPTKQEISILDEVENVLVERDIETLATRIKEAQLETKLRIDAILSRMIETCASFDADV